VRLDVALRLPGFASDNFDAVSGGSSRCASGSGRCREKYWKYLFRYAFAGGYESRCSEVTLGVKKRRAGEAGNPVTALLFHVVCAEPRFVRLRTLDPLAPETTAGWLLVSPARKSFKGFNSKHCNSSSKC
jgi:hypothetical protein